MMRKHLLPPIALLLLLALLPACQPAPAPTAALVQASTAAPTQTISATPSPTIDATQGFYQTLTAKPTRTKVATYTPKFSPTSQPICPSVFEDNAPKPEFLSISTFEQTADYEQEILDYLNTYGPDPLIAYINDEIENGTYTGELIYQDLTNDGGLELGISIDSLYIFHCSNGRYETIYNGSFLFMSSKFPQRILKIKDGNLNGFPEIVLILTEWRTLYDISVLEWDGSKFNFVVYAEKNLDGYLILTEISGNVYLYDSDGDGIDELIVENGRFENIPPDPPLEDLPWRYQIDTYYWDGEHYSLGATSYDKPYYRYQAVQDGDRYMLLGDYDAAMTYYVLVFPKEELKWFSPEYKQYLMDLAVSEFAGPVPEISEEDPNERNYLGAYVEYRIMLFFILDNDIDTAQMALENLQTTYPEGQTGHEFAVMAEEFWLAYQQSGDVGLACDAAIAVAAQHPEVLAYLGGPQHSARFDKIYGPVDVCPFGTASEEGE